MLPGSEQTLRCLRGEHHFKWNVLRARCTHCGAYWLDCIDGLGEIWGTNFYVSETIPEEDPPEDS